MFHGNLSLSVDTGLPVYTLNDAEAPICHHIDDDFIHAPKQEKNRSESLKTMGKIIFFRYKTIIFEKETARLRNFSRKRHIFADLLKPG